MRMIETFSYFDPHGRRWDAPAGYITDGATIPRTLWSSLGSPFTGSYRLAAILHDSALQNPAIVRIDADNMFYFACLAGGCTLLESKLFYAGVRLGSWATVARDFAGDLLPFCGRWRACPASRPRANSRCAPSTPCWPANCC